jgi:outer membrane protein
VVSANANYARTETRAGGVDNTNKGSTISLNLSVPIFQGGRVTAKTRQADFNYQAASQAREKSIEAAKDLARQSFSGVVNGVALLEADRRTVAAYKSVLDDTIVSFEAGLRDANDVVNAQKSYYGSQLTYIDAKYTYLTNLLLLKQATGTLKLDDLVEINRWLQ